VSALIDTARDVAPNALSRAAMLILLAGLAATPAWIAFLAWAAFRALAAAFGG
jgi:hypothetical protein